MLRNIIKQSHFSKLLSHFNCFSTSSTKVSTGLKVDPISRNNLLKLYEDLKNKLTQLPEDYVYRKGMLVLLENRKKLIKDEGYSDLDLEIKIGEGQLEELVEQAHEELDLIEKLANNWKPWEKEKVT